MGPYGTFFVAVTAFLATLLAVKNPFEPVIKHADGKKASDLLDEAAEKYKGKEGVLVAKSAGYGCLLLFGIGISLFETFWTIAAIVAKVGSPIFGWIALVIIFFAWFSVFRTKKKEQLPSEFLLGLEKAREQARQKFPDNKEAVDALVEEYKKAWKKELEEPIKVNWLEINTKRVIYFIPVLYLWYVFAVSIGILQ